MQTDRQTDSRVRTRIPYLQGFENLLYCIFFQNASPACPTWTDRQADIHPILTSSPYAPLRKEGLKSLQKKIEQKAAARRDMCVCMYTCICVYMYTCIHAYTYIHQSLFGNISITCHLDDCVITCMYICMHVCMYILKQNSSFSSALTYTRSHLTLHSHTYTCVYTVCTHTHTHITCIYI